MNHFLPETKTLVLVDVSNILMKGLSVNGKLYLGKTFVGGLYGFTAMVSTCINALKPDNIIFCVDKPPYYRDQQVGCYKHARKKKMNQDPELKAKIDTTKELVDGLLKVYPGNVWGVDGYEADDMIGYAYKLYRHRYDRIVVMSNDTDQFQLFDMPGAELFFWRGKNKPMFGKIDFYRRYLGITGPQHLRLQAVTGGHNGLEGVPNYGEKRALSTLNGPGHWILLMREWGDIVWANMQLMKLPHPRLRRYRHLLNLERPSGDHKETLDYLWEYGIKPLPSIDLALRTILGKVK